MIEQDAIKKEKVDLQTLGFLKKYYSSTEVKTQWIRYRNTVDGRIHKLEDRAEKITQNAPQR